MTKFQIILFSDKPDKVSDFEAEKIIRANENCIVFKIPDYKECGHCKYSYDIHVYNESKVNIKDIENKKVEEYTLCKDKELFDKVKYVAITASWMKEKGQRSDLKEVKLLECELTYLENKTTKVAQKYQ